jgi:hypothetical protein
VNDYLACTKAPPADVPREMGVGSCVAPRNHEGPCEYAWHGGVVRVEVEKHKHPLDTIAEVELLLKKARRFNRASMAGAALIVLLAIYQVWNVFV